MNRRDQDAFLALVSSAGPSCLRHAYLLTGNQADAEDIWQEASLQAYRSWARVRKADNPAGYLMQILINTFLTHKRKSARSMPSFGMRDAALAPPLDELVLDSIEIERLLADLSPKQRAAVVLRYYGDLPYERIASTMGVEVSSARSLVTRGLAVLRRNDSSPPQPFSKGVRQ
jgi:RNA polymerase sigma factor (sigma-70 family)